MNLKLIELIVKIAIEVGEHVVPAIIDACHSSSSQEEKDAVKHEVKKQLGEQNAIKKR